MLGVVVVVDVDGEVGGVIFCYGEFVCFGVVLGVLGEGNIFVFDDLGSFFGVVVFELYCLCYWSECLCY